MPRRHPQKGCSCTTCTNERAYNEANRERHQIRQRRWYAGLDEVAIARRRSLERARKRVLAEERDKNRLIDLTRRAT